MTRLTEDEIEHLRLILIEHASVFGRGICQRCGVMHCPTWISAYDQLAAAGLPMVNPSKLPKRAPERRR